MRSGGRKIGGALAHKSTEGFLRGGFLQHAAKAFVFFGHALGEGIESGEVYPGIGICGSGEGIAMTLNKHQGVRAGLAWCKEIAHLVRQHNDANVLVLPGRFIDNKTAEAILDEFFSATFEGGRHERRVKKIPLQK